MPPQGPCKSKGQRRFSLAVFIQIACSSGSSSGLGRDFQVVVMFIDSYMDDVIYVRYVEVCM